MTPELSVVIPAFNEAGNIGPLLHEAIAVLRSLGRSFELIVVNDGSTDGTAAEIAAVIALVPECRELRLAVHAGQGAALLAGLAAARGDSIATLDGDGQNDPADLPALLAAVETNECDLVCGWRQHRADSFVRKTMSLVANSVRRRWLQDGVHDAGCQLRVFRREVVTSLRPMELVQSFVPALAVAAGFRVAERPVRHRVRRYGVSHYGFRRLAWRPLAAMIGLRREIVRRRAEPRR